MYAVVIPVRDKDVSKGLWQTAARFFVDKGVQVYLSVNGPHAPGAIAFVEQRGITFLDGGTEYNPYTARNIGVSVAFAEGHEFVCLTDSDCEPREDYLESLRDITKDFPSGSLSLFAGRTLTRIPDIPSRHFRLLQAAGFECYDGHTPPDHTIGANMVIGYKAWETLGSMRDSYVSGGDGEYGIRFKNLGYQVTPAPSLVVYKTVYGMTLKGILEKQLRRALCFPEEMRTPLNKLLLLLDRDIWKFHMYITAADVDRSSYVYSQAIDCLFKVMSELGQLSCYMDTVEGEG